MLLRCHGSIDGSSWKGNRDRSRKCPFVPLSIPRKKPFGQMVAGFGKEANTSRVPVVKGIRTISPVGSLPLSSISGLKSDSRRDHSVLASRRRVFIQMVWNASALWKWFFPQLRSNVLGLLTAVFPFVLLFGLLFPASPCNHNGARHFEKHNSAFVWFQFSFPTL